MPNPSETILKKGLPNGVQEESRLAVNRYLCEKLLKISERHVELLNDIKGRITHDEEEWFGSLEMMTPKFADLIKNLSSSDLTRNFIDPDNLFEDIESITLQQYCDLLRPRINQFLTMYMSISTYILEVEELIEPMGDIIKKLGNCECDFSREEVGEKDNESPSQIESATDVFKNMIFVVVDDEDMILNLANKIIERHGGEVLEGGDGLPILALEAIKAYEGNIDLIITDYDMPGMNGIEFIEETRKELGDEVKVLMMSGTDVVVGDVNKSAGELAADKNIPFVKKPFQLNEFIAAIKKALGEVSN